jgi:positive regulator of sigma E activity
MDLNKIVKFDKYTWCAKIFPAVLSLIPLFIFQYFYLENLLFTQLKNIENYSIFIHLLIIALGLFVSSEVTRGFGKNLIEKLYFIRNNKFPTTQILLGKKKVISNQTLLNLKSKIEDELNLNLNSRGKEKILRINDAVNQIRSKVGYKHKILNNYNIAYGFFRNLTGGFIIYFLTTILLILFAYSNNILIFYGGILMAIVELIFLSFSWWILDNYGTKYAIQLFNLYLSEVTE